MKRPPTHDGLDRAYLIRLERQLRISEREAYLYRGISDLAAKHWAKRAARLRYRLLNAR